jgi:hypothetical protein
MTAFATVEDLAAYLRVDVAALDLDGTAALLDMASAVIRTYTGQLLDYVEDDVVTIPSSHDRRRTLFLPQLPVLAVAVTVGGVELDHDAYDFEWTETGMITRPRHLWWPRQPGQIVVTYTHGHETIPDDVKAVCVQIAARARENPAGNKAEQIDDYSFEAALPASGIPVGLAVGEAEQSVLDAYKLIAIG